MVYLSYLMVHYFYDFFYCFHWRHSVSTRIVVYSNNPIMIPDYLIYYGKGSPLAHVIRLTYYSHCFLFPSCLLTQSLHVTFIESN